MKTKVYCCFPGTGKSYFTEHATDLKISDSDSSLFHWKYDNKGNKIENENFIQDYIAHITELYNSDTYDIIFMSTHSAVLQELKKTKIPFHIIIPCVQCKCIYLQRYLARGNNSAFINRVDENWIDWLYEIQFDNINTGRVITLPNNTYISDIRDKLLNT